jgi:D-3-phosphoglycerate dehydrogenase / 2-oxoglutarate reductase
MGFQVVQVVNDGHPMPGWVPEQLSQAGIDLKVAICWSTPELREQAGEADVAWVYGGRGLLQGEALDVLKRCGAILRTGSGTDNIDVKRATELGIVVANTPQAVTDPVSDHAISLLFGLRRQVVRHDRLVREGVWNYRSALPGRRFRGATLGLVGFGRVARLLVRKLAGFQMQFLAYDPYVSEAVIAEHSGAKVGLDELLQTADAVIVLCPLTPETWHLIGERQLSLMKPQAVLVNCARGGLVDEAALIRALQEGRIAGAALDVLEQEPPAPESPLLAMENVILTPHFAGYSDDYLTDNYAASVEALVDLSERRCPFSIVNPQVEPRWGRLAPYKGK